MYTSRCCTIWNDASGLPNWVLARAYRKAAS
jgi:hypothetical protein